MVQNELSWPRFVWKNESNEYISSIETTQIVIPTPQLAPILSIWCLTSRKGAPKPVPKKIMKLSVRRYLFWIWNGRFWKRKRFQCRNDSIFYGHFQYLSHRARGFDSMATAASNRRRELARSGLHQGARQHRHFGFGILDVNYSFPTTTDRYSCST